MKAILLAGGSGSRLSPLTIATSKQLLPVYDKPLIYYSLSSLILSGAKDLLIVIDPKKENEFRSLLGDGKQFGLDINYIHQPEPKGIAQAILLGEEFIGSDNFALALGDNILNGPGLGTNLTRLSKSKGATIFASWVKEPARYGVVEFDSAMKPVSIEEKPKKPRSNYVVPGLYFYDATASERAKSLVPSERGELEITDLNSSYMFDGSLKVEILPRGTAWMDAGTFDSLADATNYVMAIEKRQGLKVGCPEEAAWRVGLIDDQQLENLAKPMMRSGYGEYLLGLLEGNR